MAFDNRVGARGDSAGEKFRRIDARRREDGISIEVLCGRAMVSPRTWFRILEGSTPRPATLRKLARALTLIERETIDLGEV